MLIIQRILLRVEHRITIYAKAATKRYLTPTYFNCLDYLFRFITLGALPFLF